jgi:hypothetical protein
LCVILNAGIKMFRWSGSGKNFLISLRIKTSRILYTLAKFIPHHTYSLPFCKWKLSEKRKYSTDLLWKVLISYGRLSFR